MIISTDQHVTSAPHWRDTPPESRQERAAVTLFLRRYRALGSAGHSLVLFELGNDTGVLRLHGETFDGYVDRLVAEFSRY